MFSAWGNRSRSTRFPANFHCHFGIRPRKRGIPPEGKPRGAFITADTFPTGHETQNESAGDADMNKTGGSHEDNTQCTGQENGPISTEAYENPWMSGWFEEELPHGAYTAQSFAGEEWLYFDMQQESSASSGSPPSPYPMPLIDFGASRTVAGTPWLIRRLGVGKKSELPAFRSAERVFRFGSRSQFSPIGRIVLRGTTVGKQKVMADLRRLSRSKPMKLRSTFLFWFTTSL